MGSNEFITSYYFPPQLGDARHFLLSARIQVASVTEDGTGRPLVHGSVLLAHMFSTGLL
jgi:hypothetical protein